MEGRPQAVFVGRDAELRELEVVLQGVAQGSGTTVLVAGEAGIGKTRLASELVTKARGAGFEVLLGRSIDLVGRELPYQPFVDALRPLRTRERAGAGRAASQLRVFEETLDVLSEQAATTPVLLVLEDVQWADSSTLDLVVFLANNLAGQKLLLLVTYRADESESAERLRRLADGVRRSGSALLLELGPLEHDDLTRLLEAQTDAPAALVDSIALRSEGNPFFAEELLARSGTDAGDLPRGLRDLLLGRVASLGPATQSLLRLASAAGRDVDYPLLRAVAGRPEHEVRESLRQAVDRGVLVADRASGSFRFRHALLAEAIYTTVLPGEREELHGALAGELTRSGSASAAEVALHWAAAGRNPEALSASVDAAREAEPAFGLAEAHSHLERALALWPTVPDAEELTGLDLSELCAWTGSLASQVGAAERAIELARRAIELVHSAPHRAALLDIRLGEYLYETGRREAGFAALERAVELVPADPPSPERAYALASLAGGLMIARRHSESLPIAEEALALARKVGAGEAEVRALTVLGGDLAHLGRAEDGIVRFRHALQLAQRIGDHWGLDRAYVNLTDTLTMLGRLGESVQVGREGLDAMRRLGIHSSLLVSNQVETLLAIGDWDEADRLSAAALRATTSSFPYALLIARALVETGRGELDAARAHLRAAQETQREDRGHGFCDGCVAELALWEHRWADAGAAVSGALEQAAGAGAAQIRIQFCVQGLRAEAELAALARARRDDEALRERLGRARELLAVARDAAAEAAAITASAAAWLALAECEHARARDEARPDGWANAARAWDDLERPPLAAYCRWRHAETLVAAGASRTEAGVPLREAHAVASRLGARPLLAQLELLSVRARLDLLPDAGSPDGEPGLGEALGLTPREAEVLTLVARGYTNREIADTLVISVKTAGVHVSHILRKLNAPNRREAAAIAHRLAPPSPTGPVHA